MSLNVQAFNEPLELSLSGHSEQVSSMLLKGTMRRRQVFKTWCLAEG